MTQTHFWLPAAQTGHEVVPVLNENETKCIRDTEVRFLQSVSVAVRQR